MTAQSILATKPETINLLLSLLSLLSVSCSSTSWSFLKVEFIQSTRTLEQQKTESQLTVQMGYVSFWTPTQNLKKAAKRCLGAPYYL